MAAEERTPTQLHEAWLPEDHPLHRPRHGRRQITAMVLAIVFFTTPLSALALGVRPAEFENRALAPPPDPADGWGFFTALPPWAVDHLPLRDVAVHTADSVSRRVFAEPSPFGSGPVQGGAPVGPVGPVAPDRIAAPAPSGASPGLFPTVLEGRQGWLYFGYDVESKCAPLAPLPDTIAALDRLRTDVEASGRRFLLVVPPDKSTAVPQHLPDEFPGEECFHTGTQEFWDHLGTRPGLVDLRPSLVELAADDVPIYHRQDTHWTDRGALTMVNGLAERIEPGITDSWVVEPGQQAQSGADLPTLLGREGSNEFRQYGLAPSGGVDRAGGYVSNLANPVQLGTVPEPGVVTAPVAIVADSFSLAATRYLQASFSDARMIFYSTAGEDPRLVAETMADQEVVVLQVVERNLAAGNVPLLDPAVLDVIGAVLAERPLG